MQKLLEVEWLREVECGSVCGVRVSAPPSWWAAVELGMERPLRAIPSRAESGGRASQLQALHLLLHLSRSSLFLYLTFYCLLLVL